MSERIKRRPHVRCMWVAARVAMHIIKRFPFVRAVFVSGDLSKNVTYKNSDMDFLIITEPGRLWIARTLLTVFKKLVLLNNKKFFCINAFVAANNLQFDERNIYTATEIATLKTLYNSTLFFEYLEANAWIKEYLPNFDVHTLTLPACSERASMLQRLFELPFRFINAERLDVALMEMMNRVWARRYPVYDEQTRTRMFPCTRGESRTFVGTCQDAILSLYYRRLERFGLSTDRQMASAHS